MISLYGLELQNKKHYIIGFRIQFSVIYNKYLKKLLLKNWYIQQKDKFGTSWTSWSGLLTRRRRVFVRPTNTRPNSTIGWRAKWVSSSMGFESWSSPVSWLTFGLCDASRDSTDISKRIPFPCSNHDFLCRLTPDAGDWETGITDNPSPFSGATGSRGGN